MMRNWKWIPSILALIGIPILVYAALPTTRVVTTVQTSATLSTSTFASSVRNGLVVTNTSIVTTAVPYVRLNGVATANAWDFRVPYGTAVFLDRDYIDRFPITSVTAYDAGTTPTVHVAGW